MRTNEALLLKTGETRGAAPLNIFGDRVWVKLAGDDTDGGCAIMEDVTQPMCGPPLHRHGREDEWFYVVEGEYLFEVDGKQIRAGQGSSVFAPRGTAHTFQNVGAKSGRLVIVVQPGGLDAFFKDLDAATQGMAEPDLSVVVPIFTRHGLQLLGPPLAARPALTGGAGQAAAAGGH